MAAMSDRSVLLNESFNSLFAAAYNPPARLTTPTQPHPRARVSEPAEEKSLVSLEPSEHTRPPTQ